MTAPPAARAVVYFARSYRRTWRASVMTTFLNPLLYLLAMGVGLGRFVNRSSAPSQLGHLSYLHFVAPALAATAGAVTAANESMYPVMGAIRWSRTYHAMLATPLRVGDVLAGHLCWIAVRVATAVGCYLVVMAAFGVTTSFEAVAILPVGVLTGMAFAAPLAAFAVSRESDESFSLIFRLGVVPLFLFSAVFYPLSQLPVGLRAVAWATPLWHGVALCRALASGRAGWPGTAGHLAYLVGVTAAGAAAARITFRRRLAP